jgi:acetyl esterase/lipase
MQTPGLAVGAEPKRERGAAWQPTAGHHQIALWPKNYHLALPETDGPEATIAGSKKVAGRSWLAALNVTAPTMTIYSPKGRNTGAAIMVFPGGGYEVLAMDLEGTEICDWATAAGMTCAVLKYRVPQNWHPETCSPCDQEPHPFLPLEDAERAMGLLRARASSLGIDPDRIGVIGFSAGGHLVAAISNATGRSYPPIDAADKLSARPNFAIALYPGHLWSGENMSLHAYDPVRPDAPPTFIAQAENDPVDDVENSISYFLALKAVKVPVEMHLYADGGHAYGLRPSAAPIATSWPKLAEKWLRTIGMISLHSRQRG